MGGIVRKPIKGQQVATAEGSLDFGSGGVSLQGPATLRLSIEMAKDQQDWRKWVWFAAILAFLITVGLLAVHWMALRIPDHFGPDRRETAGGNLALLVSYPPRLAFGRPGSIEFTVTNESQELTLDVEVSLICSSLHPVCMLSESGNTVRFGKLKPGMTKSSSIQVAFVGRGSGPATFDLKVVTRNIENGIPGTLLYKSIGSVRSIPFPSLPPNWLDNLSPIAVAMLIEVAVAVFLQQFEGQFG